MNQADFLEIMRKTLKLKALDADARLGRTRGWDSLGHIELIAILEERLDTSIPPELLGELTSVQSLLSYFKAKGLIS